MTLGPPIPKSLLASGGSVAPMHHPDPPRQAPLEDNDADLLDDLIPDPTCVTSETTNPATLFPHASNTPPSPDLVYSELHLTSTGKLLHCFLSNKYACHLLLEW